MNLWQMIETDHANIQELCREVLRAMGDGPNSRADLFAELDTELTRNLNAKQHVLYPVLMRDGRTHSYLDELEREHDDINRRLDVLAADPNKDSHQWAMQFKDLSSVISHAFSLEENGVLVVARGVVPPREAETLRRSFEREKIASLEARRWHLPEAVMPSRYGLPTGMVFGVLASVAAVGAAALLWRTTQHTQRTPLQPVRRRPEAPFPLQSGRVQPLERNRPESGITGQSAPMSHGSTDDAMLHGAGTQGGTHRSSDEHWFSSANPPRAPSGISTPLQPSGLTPGGGPAASVGSIGTGGAQTGNHDTGSLKRDGR